MFKKFFTYPVYFVIVVSIIISLYFGALIRYHYIGGKKFQSLQKIAVFFAEIPYNIRLIVRNKSLRLDQPLILKKNSNKERFKKFLPIEREGILVLPRYDHNLNRSVVDIVDLKNFKTIHTYSHNISKMNNKVKNNEIFKSNKINNAPHRFEYTHSLILEDGSLISNSDYAPLFKIDLCSNLIWLNDEMKFHHSKMLDSDNNIWVGGQINNNSNKKYLPKNFDNKQFSDDAIVKINSDGNILYKKSITQILIENNNIISFRKFYNSHDPIHLNDIEPVFSDSEYWKKGDVFISIRHQSAIIHYRPNTNKVINYITGPFIQQHDVDIISPKEISIFNNNNSFINNENSEVLIYNFETNNFKKVFNDQLKKENFKTETEGLLRFLNDGSLMIEEQNHGRIIFFNKEGQKEWEYVNKDINGDIGVVSWSRIIEDKILIKKIKSLIKSKKCTK